MQQKVDQTLPNEKTDTNIMKLRVVSPEINADNIEIDHEIGKRVLTNLKCDNLMVN